MKPIFFLLLFGLSSVSSVMANDAEDSKLAIPSTHGHEPSPVQQWLELQRSGTAASSHSQPMSGEVMEKVHQRYLKSFEKPIPEFYEHDPIAR
ncbi:DUF3613 domain-containing protein [Methylophilus methylotrophus]|uniref:DUF3613 domain-containing protein n=1 Tax=Methylophilus methylotrophus TaxID=17 RepID=UPI000F5A19D9|nr:DUF3613 domain-containing protein [Methylophilus methylotrophus]